MKMQRLQLGWIACAWLVTALSNPCLVSSWVIPISSLCGGGRATMASHTTSSERSLLACWMSSSSSPSQSNSTSSDSPDDEKLVLHERFIHRLGNSFDVQNPNAIYAEEYVTTKLTAHGRSRSAREFVFHSTEQRKELIRLKIHEDRDATFTPSHLAMVLFIACSEPQMLLRGDVLELSCGTGLGGLLSGLVLGLQQSDTDKSGLLSNDAGPQPLGFAIPTTSGSHNRNLPFPHDMKRLVLSDDDEATLKVAQKHVSVLGGADLDQVQLQVLDWRQRPSPQYAGRPNPNKKSHYEGILGAELTSTDFVYSKDLARTVANKLAPQIGRFLHVTTDSNHYIRKFLTEGYRMSVDDRYLTLETEHFEEQVLEEGKMPNPLKWESLGGKKSEIHVEILIAMHHPAYDGANGDFLFPVETGAFE